MFAFLILKCVNCDATFKYKKYYMYNIEISYQYYNEK